ncbi:MAG: ABC transporter ATP-binding protein [Mycobacteriales bacterium]
MSNSSVDVEPETTSNHRTALPERAAEEPPHTSWIRRLAPYIKEQRRSLILALVSVGIWVATVTGVPLIQKVLVDGVIISHHHRFAPWIALLLAVAVARFLTSALWRYSGGKMSLKVQSRIRADVYDTLQRLDFSGHSRMQSGQLVSRANTDLRLVQQLVSWIPMVAGNLVRIGLALVVMLVLSPVLAAVVIGVLCLVFFVIRHDKGRVYAAGWDAQQREANMTTEVEEAVTGVRVVRAFGQEHSELKRFTESLLEMYRARVRAVRMRAPFLASLQMVPMAGQVIVLLVGGLLALHGHLTVGTFLAFSGYLADLSGTTRVLGSVLTMGPQCRAAVERIGEILDLRPDITDPVQPSTPKSQPGSVDFRNVSFAYADGNGDQVLTDFTLSVTPGETVALVGPSGCGKSTALALAPRFFDAATGSVRVDGQDVRDWSLRDLRERIGMVFEDSFLFSDSVRANIAYGRPDASMDEVETAARAAAADEFIAELPDGYGTVVGEQGLTLSGGQRQRVALARALLTRPGILLLDDATSSVDVQVEKEIHDNLEPLLCGQTVVVVAYRASTVLLADRVVVVDGGTVVDEGSHDELLARSARYRELFGDQDDTDTSGEHADRVTASAWQSRLDATGTPPALIGDVMTPHLRARIDALPPADDDPRLDVVAAADERGEFSLKEFLRHWKKPLLVGLALVLMDAAVGLVGPLLVRAGVDNGMLGHSAPKLYAVCGVFAILIAFLWWDMRAETSWTGRTTERLLLNLRLRIFGHLQRLGVDYYDRTQAGRTMTRMTSDVDTVSDLLQVGLINALVSVASFLGMAGVIISLDWRLALVVLAVVPPAAFATVWYRRRASKAYDEMRERTSLLNTYLQESLAGIRVTQAYRREAENSRRFARLGDNYLESSTYGTFTTSVYVASIELLSVVAVAVVLAVGGQMVTHGALQIGVLLAFLLYLAQVFAPVQQLSSVFDVYQRARSGLVRIKELLATESSTPVADDAEPVEDVRGEIELRGVTLRYQTARDPAIHDVDLSIPIGQRVAFVGRTGAGKSTIAKLVARFYDPTAGHILIDGRPLSELDLAAYRSRLGYVPQEPFLFSRSIRDNVAYGKPDATDWEVESAARAVGAHQFVSRLQGGYHHKVTERGRSLSAGQRQLLCLARALIVDPRVLILDEATSNLDMSGERRVNRAMRRVSSGRTTIVVTHRPHALQWVDRVVRVSDGRVDDDRAAAEVQSLESHLPGDREHVRLSA